ncbi:response regulator [Corallincola platygyrae]|uniref:Response regulator n=1 Tax=Corallincola platygyrae TaxID=1193278 RepID=A0ABW4XS00_9GAMM
MKVLLAEDQDLIRGALSALLNMETDIDVVAEAKNGKEALNLLQEHTVDILLSDIEMPELDGLSLCEQALADNKDLTTMILTTFSRAGYIRRAMEMGVKGFLLKDAPAEQLAESIRIVYRGQRVYDPELVLQGMDAESPLTDKERKALGLAHQGLSSKQIAEQLFISEGTVRNYLSEAIHKLGAKNRVEAGRTAHLKGWL